MARPLDSQFDIQEYGDFFDFDGLSIEDAAAIFSVLFEDEDATKPHTDTGPSSTEHKSIATPSEPEHHQVMEGGVLRVDVTVHATVEIPLGPASSQKENKGSTTEAPQVTLPLSDLQASIEIQDDRKSNEGPITEPPPVPEEVYCGICMETKPRTEFFDTKFCTHLYCKECVASYVTEKVEEGVGWINCPEPGCEDCFLNPDTCHPELPQKVIDRWGDLVCEAMIRTKFYCPYTDCSALLMDDHETSDGGGQEETITESECPYCYRLFCAQCRSPWHEGIKCEEVQKMGEGDREREDLMLKEVAENSHWQRCPECKFFVERNEGCNHITCRCKYEFCYICGAKWEPSHYSCTGAEKST